MSTLTKRRWTSWAVDALEHTARAFATGVAAVVLVSGDQFDAILSAEPYKAGTAAAVVALLISLGAKRVGSPATASFSGRGKQR